MCGPTRQEHQEAALQQEFQSTTQQNYSTLFNEQQQAEMRAAAQIEPILAGGPSQAGMSAAQLAAETTQAIDTTGANYANAARALGGQLAGTGSSSGLTTGPEAQLKAALASTAAGQLSAEELGITQQNYALGRENWMNAVNAQQALIGDYSPSATGGLVNTAGENAFKSAETIKQQEDQETQAIAGAVETGASALMGGFGNLDTTGGSTGGEQVQNFLTGMFS